MIDDSQRAGVQADRSKQQPDCVHPRQRSNLIPGPSQGTHLAIAPHQCPSTDLHSYTEAHGAPGHHTPPESPQSQA